MSCFFS